MKISPYNKNDPQSIEAFAKRLLNMSLKQVLGADIIQKYSGKGKLGQVLEDLYFGYKPNSNAEPDFKEAGVELKTSPLKNGTNGYTSKERLVFSIINYEEVHKEAFLTSNFWRKNKLLLLMFYLHEHEKFELDFIFKIIQLFEFPATDIKIIEDDWLTIITKIKQGKAHEISEGDTLYLGACTKGANKTSLRTQPFSEVMAMQRAFSLKSKYLNFIISKALKAESEPIVKSIDEYSSGETFEYYITKRFQPFLGLTDVEISNRLRIKVSSSKSKFYVIAKAILGVVKNKIEEFEKADVQMKTIRLQSNGNIKESMSFAQIQFKTIINEEWEESYWNNMLSKRFFFVIFQQDENGTYKFKGVKFWTMPSDDLKITKEFWLDTKNKIANNDFNHFMKISDNKICHVRPKGLNSLDLMETSFGTLEKKKSYWLNSSYIKKVINSI